MTQRLTEANKQLGLEAFDVLFNKRDYNAALRFWSPNYIQHSAHIPQGREGLFNLIRGAPAAIRGRADLGRRRVRERPRQIFGQWAAAQLDRRRHCAHRRWPSRGALGRAAGRGDKGRIAERTADVWD